MAMGERTPLALIDAPASGRMAVAEAITNIVAADIASLGDVKLSANWMAPAGHPGDDAALYDTVRAVALDLCARIGLSIPVGKDSMSMRTTWREGGVDKAVTAPVSLVVSAFAPVTDVRRTATPLLRRDATDAALLLIDIAGGRRRLGGSALAQVYGQLGNDAPDLDDPARLAAFFAFVARLRKDGNLIAYHDVSDGGVLVTLAEMAFASHCGLEVALPGNGDVLATLFAEELGAVVQVPTGAVTSILADAQWSGLAACEIGRPTAGTRIRIAVGDAVVLDESRTDLHRAWSSTTHAMQRMRDNPDAADEEYERLQDAGDPGLSPRVTFDAIDAIAAPFVNAARRPAVAVLREQGVNGHVEMAAAFDRAGFDAYDVHMSDLAAGRRSLADFHGFVACGGFSYGDVLGAGEGWAKSILFNERVCHDFAAFFARDDTFALGVCNGCQMMSALSGLVPGGAPMAALRPQRERAVRGASRAGGDRALAVAVLPRHGRHAPAGGDRAWRRARGIPRRRARGVGAVARRAALRRPSRQRDRGVSVQSEWFAGRHHRPHERRRPLHDPDAASRARVAHGADVVASRRLGRDLAVVPHVRQRARVARLARYTKGAIP